MRGQVIALAAAALLSSAVVACGGGKSTTRGSSDATVAEQVKSYFTAIASGDAETACARLTDRAAHDFEAVFDGPVAQDCETNMKKLTRTSYRLGPPHISGVSIHGSTATARAVFKRYKFDTGVPLVREQDGWKLSFLVVPPLHLSGPPGIPKEKTHGSS
jgi:hypothetical protein